MRTLLTVAWLTDDVNDASDTVDLIGRAIN